MFCTVNFVPSHPWARQGPRTKHIFGEASDVWSRKVRFSSFWCMKMLCFVYFDKRKYTWCKILAVSNCPRCQIVRFYPWCQIVRGVKLSWCQIVRCQIVRGVKLSGVKLSAVSNCPPTLPVSNCPRCQIVLVSNCPRIKIRHFLSQNVKIHHFLLRKSWFCANPA